jgi:thiol-disulfide isomerase/thioredoxin
MRSLIFLPPVLLLSASAAWGAAREKPFALMVGDPAPPLAVGKWLKGEPVAEFRKGRVYVVEFWATWCGPCKRSIPHLSGLQKKYSDDVTFIGVSVWEPRPEEVAPFVARMGPKMAYAVATDDCPPAPAGTKNASVWALDHGKMSAGWMKASGWAQEGIPAAFVVDRQGHLAWAGEPQELDEPLGRVVAGNWDLSAEAGRYRQRMDLAVRVRGVQSKLNEALKEHDGERAVRACDEMLALDPRGSAHIAGCKFQTLLTQVKDPGRAYAFAREAIDKVARDDASALGQIAWVIVHMGGEDGKRHIDLALEAAGRANDLAGGTRPGVLETLAHIHFLKGDPRKAAEYQERALAAAGDDAGPQMKKALQKYKEAARR